MKSGLFLTGLLCVLLSVCLPVGEAFGRRVATVSSDDHEAVKASIVETDPARFTINVKTLANIGVDDDAPTFAVYVTRNLPDVCGDFRKLKLPYAKPSRYTRRFDLSAHPEVITALQSYGCVVMRNIPSED